MLCRPGANGADDAGTDRRLVVRRGSAQPDRRADQWRGLQAAKLAPNDEIELGRHRYRINYETPKYRFGRKTDGNFQAVVAPKAGASAPKPPVPGGELGRLVPLGGGPDFAPPEGAADCRPQGAVRRRHRTRDGLLRGTASSSLSRDTGLSGISVAAMGRALMARERRKAGFSPNGRVTIGDQRFQLEYRATGPPPIGAVAVHTDRSLLEQVGLDEDGLDHAVPRENEDPVEANKRRWTLT